MTEQKWVLWQSIKTALQIARTQNPTDEGMRVLELDLYQQIVDLPASGEFKRNQFRLIRLGSKKETEHGDQRERQEAEDIAAPDTTTEADGYQS